MIDINICRTRFSSLLISHFLLNLQESGSATVYGAFSSRPSFVNSTTDQMSSLKFTNAILDNTDTSLRLDPDQEVSSQQGMDSKEVESMAAELRGEALRVHRHDGTVAKDVPRKDDEDSQINESSVVIEVSRSQIPPIA